MDTVPFHVTPVYSFRRTMTGRRNVRVRTGDSLLAAIYMAECQDRRVTFHAGIYSHHTPGFCAAPTTTRAYCHRLADDEDWAAFYDLPRSFNTPRGGYPIPSLNVMLDHPAPYTYKDLGRLEKVMLNSLAGAAMGWAYFTSHGAVIGASNDEHQHYQMFEAGTKLRKVRVPLQAMYSSLLSKCPRKGKVTDKFNWLEESRALCIANVHPTLLLTPKWHNDNSENMVHNMALVLNSSGYEDQGLVDDKTLYWREKCQTVGYVNLFRSVGGD